MAEIDNWLAVFKDEKLNKSLKRDGIVKFDLPFLDLESCDMFLRDSVVGYPIDFESAFYGSVSISDIEVKRKIEAGLRPLLSPTIESLLVNHKLLTYFFLVKGIGGNSILRLHQDWSIIDERKYRAYSLWIPLCDSTTKNGTLYAMKGSHKFPLNIRGTGIPSKYGPLFNEAEKYLKPIKVKAGEALLFDSRLLHYSPPNKSNKSRTAIVNNIIPTISKSRSFHGKQIGDTLEVSQYDVPKDLFIHYDEFNSQKDLPNPKGVFVEKIDYANDSEPTIGEFREMLKKYNVKKKFPFI